MADPYILMLGHDEDDQQLTMSILDELQLQLAIRFVPGAARLFEALQDAEPMLILLEFNVKPETGLDILESIRANAAWRHIPVVLLGDSRDPHFVRRCYEQGANSYVAKPTSLKETRRVIGSFFSYWLQVAETPAHSAKLKPVAP